MREQRMSMLNPLARDLDHVLAQTEELWRDLRGERIFITGGTGFFGCWLLESFTWANKRLRLGASAVVPTRNPDAFREKAPHLAEDFAIHLQSGDISSFHFPEGEFPIVIHAATERYFEPSPSQPLSVFDRDIEATRRVLEFARSHRTRRFLLTSSGAVYGKQPPDLTHLPEDYPGAPATTGAATAYGQSKRASEFMCSMYARQYGFHAAIARCFAFVGPYLPLDANYAIGNFIRDALMGNPIVVKGDGTPFRSYLYAADLAIWLWTILMRGESCRPYNVGSEQDLTIAELAALVSTVAPGSGVRIACKAAAGVHAERYVPDTARARTELGLTEHVPLTQALDRTLERLRVTIPSNCCTGKLQDSHAMGVH
jgi:nucleoside-diphosphate-sugar epimerase